MTKRLTLSLLVATALSTSFCAIAMDTFEDGFKAASAGKYSIALKIWTPLADKNDALAQSNLGILYENGWGVEQSPEMAFYWYKKAAEQGQVDAQHNMASLYQQGIGVEKDLDAAGAWYEKAATKGHGDSQLILGVMYQEVGEYQQAAYWYHKAIQQKVEGAQKNLEFLCQLNSVKIEKLC